jgi:hypothetical protein
MSVPHDPRPFPLQAAPEHGVVRLESRPGPHDESGGATTTSLSDELRAVLIRTEDGVDLLRGTAAELKAVLPTRVEAAVSRALASREAAATGTSVDLGETCRQIAGAVDGIGRDVLAERLSRAEDLEVLVDLVRAATAEVKADVERVERQVADLAATVATLAGTVRDLAPTLAAVSTKLDRPLAVTVEARPVPVRPRRSSNGSLPQGADTY